jgi:hypothetical protein
MLEKSIPKKWQFIGSATETSDKLDKEQPPQEAPAKATSNTLTLSGDMTSDGEEITFLLDRGGNI